jgi:hypothetical protein
MLYFLYVLCKNKNKRILRRDFQFVKLAQESKHMVVLARHLKFTGRI